MRRLCRAGIVIGIAAALAGCQSIDVRALDGTQWRAVGIAGVGALPARAPMITFKGGGASGFGTCSSFSITGLTVDASVNPARLRFGGLSTQNSACADDLQRVDAAFFRALTVAQSIRRDGGRLILDGPGGMLVFEFVPAAQAAPATPHVESSGQRGGRMAAARSGNRSG